VASPDNALQAGIYTRLNNFAALTAVIGSNQVYDFVPESAQPPYVVIGDDTATDWDTKSKHGWEFTVTLHCWSFETAGRKQVKTILSHVHDALHQQEANITVSGFTLVQIRREFQQTFQETAAEGQSDRYWHGVARYRAVVHA
jgi:hypothetical protein